MVFYGPDNFYDHNTRPVRPPMTRKARAKVYEQQASQDRAEARLPSSIADAILTCSDLERGPVRCADVLNVVAFLTGHLVSEICGPRRDHKILPARMVYYWIARKYTGKSLPVIGQVCGGRDHCTVLSGLARVEREMPLFTDLIVSVEKRLGLVG